jgi:hypothetical protein
MKNILPKLSINKKIKYIKCIKYIKYIKTPIDDIKPTIGDIFY